MIINLQKFFELLAFMGGLACFTEFFFDTVRHGNRTERIVLGVCILFSFFSSFVIEG